MAQTTGDVISRNYMAGRAIGDDFSSSRFSRNAAKVRQEYEDRAATEGKALTDYLPEMESRLRELATSTGAARRGLDVDDRYVRNLRQDAMISGERRAGALATSGDITGAQRQRASTGYALGQYDAGEQQQRAAETTAATTGAMRPDGTYNAAQGAQQMAGIAARYGDAAGAAGQQQAGTTFRLEAARAKADSLFNMAQNPNAFSPDQFAGAWEGLKENVPELTGVDLRKGPDDVLYLYTGGKASGSFDPKNQTDVQELSSLLSQFTKDPGASLQGYMKTRMESIAAAKERDNKVGDDYRGARIDVVKSLTDKGVPADLASKVIEAQNKLQTGSNGWQLQDIGEEPGSYLMQKNGQVYTVKTNVQPDLAKGETGGTLQVFDGEGNPVSASVLNKEDRASMSSALIDLSAAQAASNYRLKAGVVSDQLKILNTLEAQERGLSSGGTGASRADRNNNPGNIEDGSFAKGLPGYAGGDGRFAKFESPEAGQAAQTKLLGSYGRRGYNTVDKVVGRWSPQADASNPSGSTANYARYVAQRLGVQPDQELDLEDPKVAAEMAMAMYEFESGNRKRTGALPTGSRTAVSTPTPTDPARGGSRSGVEPKPSSRRTAISPEYVRGAAGELRNMASAFDQKRAALQRFDEDMGTELQEIGGPGYQGGQRMAIQRPVNLTPEQARVRDRLAAEVQQAERSLREAEGELRSNTGALKRQANTSKAAKAENELYARYGGAADFFSRAGGSR
jgi:hypothetical protein